MIRRNPRPLEIYFPPLNYYAEWHYFKTQHVSCSTACQYISARVIYPVRSGVGCIMSEQTRKSMFMIFFFLKSMFKVFSFSIFLFFCKSIFKKWFVIKTRLENRWEFENENPLPLSGNAKIKILFCHNLLIKKTNHFSFSWKIQTIVTRREHSLQLEFCPQSTDTLNNYSPYKLITTFFVLPFGTSNVE